MRESNSLKWCIRSLLILALLGLWPWVQAGVAQIPPPPRVVGIEPNEGQAGGQIQATIQGSGFDQEAEVIIEGLKIEVVRRSAQTLLVQIFIPDDAPPGPRDVIVINHVGQAQEGRLPGGFIVLGRGEIEPAPTEPSDEENGDIPWGIFGLLLGLLALVAAPVAAYLAWDAGRRRRLTRQRQELERWQEEAQQELTRDCRPGAKLPIIGRKVKSGTWEIVHLVFTVEVSVAGGPPYDDLHSVGGKIVQRLNEIAALRKRTSDEDRLRRMVTPVAGELAGLLWIWTRQKPLVSSITIQANVEGKVTYEFRLYECQKTDEGNHWQKKKDWEGSVKETRELPAGDLVGPQEREGKGQFRKRAAGALIVHLLDLTSQVSSI